MTKASPSALAPFAALTLLAACAAREPNALPSEPPRTDARPAVRNVLAADSPRSGLRAAAAPASGEALFVLHCAPCHGDDGTGGGRFWSSAQTPAPPSLVAPPVSETPAEVLAETIAKGHHRGADDSLCPPFGTTLEARDIDAIVLFLRAAR